MNLSKLPTEDDQTQGLKEEVEQLRAQVETLEQLLEVYEKETSDKSARLEKTLAELNEHTQRLSHSETALSTLRAMLNSMGEAVIVVDFQGKFLFRNAPAEALLGVDCYDTLTGWAKQWQAYLPDQVTPYPSDQFPLWSALRGEAPEAVELYMRSPQATQGNWFSVTARALLSSEGEQQGGVAVFHNITPLKQGEIALRQSEMTSRQQAQQLQAALNDLHRMQSQLVQTEKMSSLGQLVAGIAHEINNPVNFIYGNLVHARSNVEDLFHLIELYQTHYPEPHPDIQAEAEEIDLEFLQDDLLKLLSSMKMGSERIRGIVSSLRTFSRMDEAEKKSIDIHEGIESTLMILQSQLKAKAESCEVQIVRHYETLPTVECYAGQLNQVFMNLLGNAIDALEEVRLGKFPEKGTPTIEIRTRLVASSRVIVEIEDNGTGIPTSILTRIFDPFYTTKAIGKGTGMGLSISYQIVTEKHGGTLTCTSEPGKGTTFVVAIPLQQE